MTIIGLQSASQATADSQPLMTEHLTASIQPDKASHACFQSKQLPAPLAGGLDSTICHAHVIPNPPGDCGAHLCLLIGKQNFRVFLRQEAVRLPLLRQGLQGRRRRLPWC